MPTVPLPTPAADPLANIPVDNNYSEAEASQVAAIINSGQMTVEQVADKFNLDTGTVQTALDRINTVPAASGQTTTDFDPTNVGETTGVTEGTIGTTGGGTAGGQTVTINTAGDQVISGETVTDGEDSGDPFAQEKRACAISGGTWNNETMSCDEKVVITDPHAKAKADCATAGGTWDSTENKCIPKATDKDWTAEITACANQGGTWDSENNVCIVDGKTVAPAWETAMKAWIAANPNATDAQGAAWLRDNLPEGVTLADAARALNIPLDVAQKRFGIATEGRAKTLQDVSDTQLAGLDLKFKDDPLTTTIDESTLTPGNILKDYRRVDPSLLIEDREAAAIDIERGITTDAQIQALDAYTDINPPLGVKPNTWKAATGLAKTIITTGKAPIGSYNAILTEILNEPQFATDHDRKEIIGLDEIRGLTERVRDVQFRGAPRMGARVSEFEVDPNAFVSEVTPREKVRLSQTPEAEDKTRDQLTTTAADSVEHEITKMADYEARQRANVTGEAAIAGAIGAVAEVSGLPPEVAKAVVADAGEVAERIDAEAPEVIAQVAALDPDFLLSSQIESLIGGMESGNIPSWAKPAYDAVNQKLAQRGLEVSTVGRDALFNAIIQNAIPIAQSNAQALQARATRNLDAEQQAELTRAQLNSTRRLANVGNQQTASSQTAQFAQNIKLTRGQFEQEKITLSEQQEQQIRVQNLQNRQRSAEQDAQQAAANAAQNLGNRQQIELAELEIKNQTEQQNMTAKNQERLAEFQVASEFISKNGDFAQQMQLANLSNDQQTRLANLTSRNQADSESLSNEQQTELANLNMKMQTNITSANLAQQMGLAQLNVDQQSAIQNATMVANIDLTKFSDAQQVELANSKFMQTVGLTDFNARQQSAMQDATALASLDLAAVDQRTKLRITQAQNFLQRDMANLSNEQQALILDNQLDQQRLLTDVASGNAAQQFNASSENQINQFNENLATQIQQFNRTQQNSMEQFNKAETNRVKAIQAGNDLDAAKFNNQLTTQLSQFNEQMDLQRDQWNATNAQAIEQSNVQWRRQANTINTAAVNAANQENAAKAFQISAADQNFMWQELRDEAAYLRQAYENDEQRQTTLYATAIANDIDTGAIGIKPIVAIVDDIMKK